MTDKELFAQKIAEKENIETKVEPTLKVGADTTPEPIIEVLDAHVIEEPVKPKRHRKERRMVDKLFVPAYIKHKGNATKAAMEVTGATTPASARNMGHALKKRNEEQIEVAMERYGLTQAKVMTKHAQLLDSENDGVAMKAIDTYYRTTKKGADGGSDVNIHFNF